MLPGSDRGVARSEVQGQTGSEGTAVGEGDREDCVSERYASQQGNPAVRGRCPACGSETLFLGNSGYVTCSVIGCVAPGAAAELLDRDHRLKTPERWALACRKTVELIGRVNGGADLTTELAEALVTFPR